MACSPDTGPAHGLATRLNASRAGATLDRRRLLRALAGAGPGAGLGEQLAATRPHLLAAVPVFISDSDHKAIAALVAALENVSGRDAYRRIVLANAPAIAHRDFGPRGGIISCDFHLGPSGPRLIEVNTNPGGMLLSAALASAHRTIPGRSGARQLPDPTREILEGAVFDTFQSEWRSQRGGARLRHVAIVDDDPRQQYLYPEFRLFERLFRRQGIGAGIATASALEWRDGALWDGSQRIDLVYNRLTDFYLEDPAHAALRAAYLAGAVVLTPDPRAHAIHANKRNLVSLGDAQLMESIGVDAATQALLHDGIAHTQLVSPDNAVRLWSERSRLFFKPAAGYGSKAVYRGDKLTSRVWAEIVAGNYVAQDFVAPTQRLVALGEETVSLKFDLRAYAFGGETLLLAARLYRGQTTNFRTPGGGLAPVVVVADRAPEIAGAAAAGLSRAA